MSKTGATRYIKFLKSEKAKTKLKSKKELPKGTNITKTNFKVKKIVIKEQLKKHGDTEQLSTRKLNAKELLTRLNHFNTNSRTDALEGLKELISSHPDVLKQNLGQIIHGVTPLTLNVEKVVRRDTLKVLHLILKTVEQEKLDPFFDIMSTYLRSAMTHIDSRIQEDSLLFLDVLLNCTPGKISDNFHKIVPNFLDMISKLRVDAKPGRTLTVNLNSQITSAKWRIKVIHRLQDFLHKYIEYNRIGSHSNDGIITKTFDPLKFNHYSILSVHNIAVTNILNVSNNTQSLPNAEEGNKFQNYVDTLMPLLIESWLEVCPNSTSGQGAETVVSHEAALLLRHILQLISLLYKFVLHFNRLNPNSDMEALFLQKYKAPLVKHFINSFPYVTNIRLKREKSFDSMFEDVIIDPKLVAENLELCHLFIKFNPNINKKQGKDIHSVLTYIEKMFSGPTSEVTFDNLLNVIHTLFSDKFKAWTTSNIIMEMIFIVTVYYYFNEHSPDNYKQKIFALLCEITLNETISDFNKTKAYRKWLNEFPDILLNKSVTVQTVDIIHKLATTNNALFNSVIKSKLLKILENLPNIVISDCVVGTDSYHKLFSLIYWIKTWDTECLNLLENQLMNNVYKNNYGKYIFDTLRLKSGGIL